MEFRAPKRVATHALADPCSRPLPRRAVQLWWPQCEAMVAFAKLHEDQGDPCSLKRLQMVTAWALKHLATDKEWLGYLDRGGEPTHRFKGGPFKGCFHVPRALLLVDLAVSRRLELLGVKVELPPTAGS